MLRNPGRVGAVEVSCSGACRNPPAWPSHFKRFRGAAECGASAVSRVVRVAQHASRTRAWWGWLAVAGCAWTWSCGGDTSVDDGVVVVSPGDVAVADASSDASVAPDVPPVACTSDAECAVDGPLSPCEGARCVAGECVVALDPARLGAPCDDEDPCTHGDSCLEAVGCSGEAYSCSAPSACETAVCDGGGGCDVAVAPGMCSIDGICYVALEASAADACMVCDPGADPLAWTARGCGCSADADCVHLEAPCSRGVCDLATRSCVIEARLGASCDDGENCTHSDKCHADGTCSGEVYPCGVPSPCQYATCDGAGGCEVGILPGFCRVDGLCRAAGDGNPEDTCLTCEPTANPTGWSLTACECLTDDDCPDPTDPCLTAECDDVSGLCETEPEPGVACDDGDACTTDDACGDDGVCGGASYACVSSECEARTCDGQGGCQVALKPGTCLIEGTCYLEGEVAAGDACLACDTAASQTMWSAGGCECASDAQCAGLSGTCRTGQCLEGVCAATIHAGSACDDGQPCTSDDTCDADAGCAGLAYDCGPGDECSAATCDGDGGCDLAIEPGWCRVLGSCVEGGVTNPIDTCSECDAEGAPESWSAKALGAACDDGNPITEGDQCVEGGGCVGACGVPPTCHEVDPATGCSTGVPMAGWCFIDSVCVAEGVVGAAACEVCDTELSTAAWTLFDADGDGTCDDGDCRPYDAAVFPGGPEHCDGLDNDCDGATDEDTPICFLVDDLDDLVDADPGDGECASPEGTCTLRAAVMEANASGVLPTPAAIWIPAGVVALALVEGLADGAGDLDILQAMVIRGAGAGLTSISADGAFRIFEVHSGAELRLAHVTVRDGDAGEAPGGGILNHGRVWVSHAVLTNNETTGDGGALANVSAGNAGEGTDTAVVIARCNVHGNAAERGGGLFTTSGGADANLLISDSAVHGNIAGDSGGGLFSVSFLGSEHIELRNATVAANVAGADGGGVGFDPEHAAFVGLTLTHTTIFGNTAEEDGGALSGERIDALTARNNLLAGNFGPAWTPDVHLEETVLLETVGNIVGDATGILVWSPGPSDLFGSGATPIDPKLGPLADNGGPTPTQALLPGSPALGWAVYTATAPADQRGVVRPAQFPDAGAVELCGDSGRDADGDGVADACDVCPRDRFNDVDDDGLCADVDPCHGGVDGTTSAEVCDGRDNDCNGLTDEGYQRCYVVTDVADSVDALLGDGVCADALGRCTLRAAVMETGALPAGPLPFGIYVPPGHYTLPLEGAGPEGGDLNLVGEVQLRGAGASVTTIDAVATDRVFAVVAEADVLLAGLTLTGGLADVGGGLLNFGATELRDCVVTGNGTVAGAAIQHGGGIASRSGDSAGATLVLRRCTVSANLGEGGGGGVAVAVRGGHDSVLEVYDSAFIDNRSIGGRGGAVYVHRDGEGDATGWFSNTTFAGNEAIAGGAVTVADAFGDGGAWVTLQHCTVAQNQATQGGGVVTDFASATFANSLIAGNSAVDDGDDVLNVASGSLVFIGGNAVGSYVVQSGTASTLPSDQVGTVMQPLDALLGELGVYGGPTATFPLLSQSPAIDAALPMTGVTKDQRGFGRSLDGDADGQAAPDSGAYELAP